MSKKFIKIVVSFIGFICTVPYIKGNPGEWGNVGPAIATLIFIVYMFINMGLFSHTDEN